jgi:threonine dehydrogenase-like Zn-dependent dehydrogenase
LKVAFPGQLKSQTGQFDPQTVLTRQVPLTEAIEAFKAFDQRQKGWMKVELKLAA